MRLLRLSTTIIGFLWLGIAAARAESAPDPLRLVPDAADVMVEIKNPRRLAETVTQLDLVKQAQELGPVREVLDSTNYRRFYQLVAYFEKQLGAQWPELFDRLAGGGIVLAAQIGPNPAPALLVVQGTDEKLTRRFVDLGLQILEQEIARREGKERVEKAPYRGIDAVHLGKEFHAAVVGSALLISNNDKSLHAALDLHLDGGKNSLAHSPTVAEARKLLPADPLASLWLNLETVQKEPKVKDVFASGRDPNLTVLFGGWLDAARRSPYLCAALGRESGGFLLTLRMPGGRDGGGPEQAVHVPPPGVDAAPLLEPRGVVLSHSFYLNVGKFWDDRAKIFTAAQVKSLEDIDGKSAIVLAGQKLSNLLQHTGARHRFVAANQRDTAYKRQPKQPIPAFAVVAELRDPAEFTKTMNTVLRGVALLAGSQYKLKLVDATHGDYKIIAYRFAEDAQLAQDPDDVRFNFSPCFVTVGNQFIASSTIELCHELIDLLEKETKPQLARETPAAMRTLLYSAGSADSLEIGKDALLSQTVLGRAVTIDEARAETKALIDLVRRLGLLKVETNYTANDFRVDVRWQLTK
jgi:hypothetical protein